MKFSGKTFVVVVVVVLAVVTTTTTSSSSHQSGDGGGLRRKRRLGGGDGVGDDRKKGPSADLSQLTLLADDIALPNFDGIFQLKPPQHPYTNENDGVDDFMVDTLVDNDMMRSRTLHESSESETRTSSTSTSTTSTTSTSSSTSSRRQRRTNDRAGEPPPSEFPEDDVEGGAPEGQQPPQSKQPAWPHELSDIPLDPAIRVGELSNGLRYYVRPNSEPPGQLELRLHIDAGANFESDEERGIAHFLEHMMFQTTDNFPLEGELVPTFQRMGVGFGSHLNAYTNLEETVYFLELPNTNNETLDIGMAWMHDILGGGAMLEQNEIDRERGVVISELQVRDSVNRRLTRSLYEWLLPDSLLSQRFVIGLEDTIEGFTKQMFDDFYATYYIPPRATFIVVGDMNATDMITIIEETFGDIGASSASESSSSPEDEDDDSNSTTTEVTEQANDDLFRGPEPDYGTATEGLGLRSMVLIDEEVVGNSITMNTIRNTEFQPDTVQGRIETISTNIVNGILAMRLRDLGTLADSVITSGSVGYSNLYDFANSYNVVVYPKEGPTAWREAVSVLEQEWRRMFEYGPTVSEVEENKAKTLNSYERAILTQDTRQSGSLAGTLNGAINGYYVVSTPEENLRIAKLALEGMTPESLHHSFQSNWNTTDINIYLATDSVNGTVEEIAQELQTLFLHSQQVPVEPPLEDEPVVWNYTDFGPAGTVVSDTYVDDLQIRQLVLSNNVRVNMKPTDFRSDSISFRARFGLGKLSQPKNATYLDRFTQHMLSSGGLGEHDVFDIRTALAGKSIGFGFNILQGDFVMGGGSSREDLELALQFLTAHITDPAFRDEVVGWWQDDVPNMLESIRFSLGGAYSYDLFAWLLGGDERFTAPTEEELMAFVASDASDWLVPSLNNSYLEFSIVGDFNETEALEMILSTIGALPEREDAIAEIRDADRAIDIPEPQSNSFTYETKLPQAGAWVAWEIPSDVSHDIAFFRQTNVLAAVFRDRMRILIREEMGGAYSPGASATRSETFDYGFLIASAQGLPEEVPVFTDIILGIAANISTGDITQDEFDRALLPFQSSLTDSLRDNGYWLNVMDQCQAEPYRLDWARGRDEFYADLTMEEINAIAMEYLSPDVAYPMSIIPINITETAEG